MDGNRLVIFDMILFLLIISSSSFITMSTLEDNDTIEVPTHYATIQEAINAASPGDIILVSSGTYYEHLIVNKSISLKSVNLHEAIIDGNGTGTVIRILEQNIRIEGFIIQNSGELMGAGAHVLDTNASVIIGNIFSQCDVGVRVDTSDYTQIEENVFKNNKVGVLLWYHGQGNIVKNNTMKDNGEGVRLGAYSSGTKVNGNTIFRNHNGVYIDNSWNNTIEDNVIYENSLDGIYLYGVIALDNVVRRNNITENRGGIYVFISKENLIYHNNFINNTRQAQVLGDSPNSWNLAYPEAGNHWSNHVVTDLYRGFYQNVTGSDGVGDVPYIIDQDNIDRYPFVSEFVQVRDEQTPYTPLVGILLVLFMVGIATLVIMPRLLLRRKGREYEQDEVNQPA
ncbi:MAG: right-handed parallel beta-helix repeat-containing protein [Candidatus Bathyarchaeota archaeon]|nr:MAG: right-handed parallel beta-helix repeat-containing protein [Candidatus Bathyarchaeota archaeon]